MPAYSTSAHRPQAVYRRFQVLKVQSGVELRRRALWRSCEFGVVPGKHDGDRKSAAYQNQSYVRNTDSVGIKVAYTNLININLTIVNLILSVNMTTKQDLTIVKSYLCSHPAHVDCISVSCT